MKLTILQSVLLLALQITTTFAIAEQNFIDAQEIFEQSLAGNESKTTAAIDSFQTLVNNNPEQPLFLVYLGSAYTLKARDSWMPWTRLSNVDTGLEKIDKAIQMLTPEHGEQKIRGSIISIETRLVAISTFLQVPGFLNRFQDAKDLMHETVNSPAYPLSPPIVKGRLQLWAAEIAIQDDDSNTARVHLEQAIKLLPDGRFSNQAHERLSEITLDELNKETDEEI
ncbi:hypothetical protein MNBD_GAMMA06-1252 [hydrothermal vent metagenome]|uniref:Uncharacterized protein n=1 Tax=hydrothermal vent metagenome TaxID=652676 RepID=A0A3B0W8M4_9ZZZZ